MQLSDQIKNYYFANISNLPPDKQFHFASRIASWQADREAISLLAQLKSYVLPASPEKTLRDVMQKPIGKLYAKEMRQKYFDKYPTLFGIHNALFRTRHLLEIYGIDARLDFLRIVNQSELDKLYEQIINDDEALRILSRFAVDYIYLYELLYETKGRLAPRHILNQQAGYDLEDPAQLNLFIYLYTHSIIADSNFYARPVPTERLPIYSEMLDRVEELVAGRSGIKMDSRFEFLVVCRICLRDTQLNAAITQEAAQSLSPHGTFIIDKLNGGPDTGLNGLARSEHRNVLYIMSQSEYRPLAGGLAEKIV